MAVGDLRLQLEVIRRRALVRALHWREPMLVEVAYRITLPNGETCPLFPGEMVKLFRLPGAPPGSLDDGVWIPWDDL